MNWLCKQMKWHFKANFFPVWIQCGRFLFFPTIQQQSAFFSILLVNVFCMVSMRNTCFCSLNPWRGHQQALEAGKSQLWVSGSVADQSSSSSVHLKNKKKKRKKPRNWYYSGSWACLGGMLWTAVLSRISGCKGNWDLFMFFCLRVSCSICPSPCEGNSSPPQKQRGLPWASCAGGERGAESVLAAEGCDSVLSPRMRVQPAANRARE